MSGTKVVAWRTDIFENLPNGKLTRLILDAEEVTDPGEDWTALYAAPPSPGWYEAVEALTEVLDDTDDMPGDTPVVVKIGKRVTDMTLTLDTLRALSHTKENGNG